MFLDLFPKISDIKLCPFCSCSSNRQLSRWVCSAWAFQPEIHAPSVNHYLGDLLEGLGNSWQNQWCLSQTVTRWRSHLFRHTMIPFLCLIPLFFFPFIMGGKTLWEEQNAESVIFIYPAKTHFSLLCDVYYYLHIFNKVKDQLKTSLSILVKTSSACQGERTPGELLKRNSLGRENTSTRVVHELSSSNLNWFGWILSYKAVRYKTTAEILYTLSWE